jgi:hypothetical protein
MSSRFLMSILFFSLCYCMVVHGLVRNQVLVYQKPDARDDQVNLPKESSFLVGELHATDWISKERLQPDGFGHLIDLKQEAECFS